MVKIFEYHGLEKKIEELISEFDEGCNTVINIERDGIYIDIDYYVVQPVIDGWIDGVEIFYEYCEADKYAMKIKDELETLVKSGDLDFYTLYVDRRFEGFFIPYSELNDGTYLIDFHVGDNNECLDSYGNEEV